MKVNLVVAVGVHAGKAIPVPGNLFTIGRDPECNLRPASPAVSKKHCQISVRNGAVHVKDLGSTNGTTVNDVVLTGEAVVADGDRLKIGPLDFRVQIIPAVVNPDNTPLPDTLKPLPSDSRLLEGLGAKPAAKAGTPAPMPPAAAKPTPAPVAPAAQAPKPPAPVVPKPKPKSPAPAREDDPDAFAAMMMAEGDEEAGPAVPVPEGSTVMELPAIDMDKVRQGGPSTPGAKKPVSAADSSNAASEALKRYFQKKK